MFNLNSVNILSQKLIEEYFIQQHLLTMPAVRISITDYDPEFHVRFISDFLIDELRIEFQDLTYEEVQRPELSIFRNSLCTLLQAQQIVEFLCKYKEYPLIVNCYAGVSRSAAVGKIACKIKQIDDSWIVPPQFNPNPYVYSLLEKKL